MLINKKNTHTHTHGFNMKLVISSNIVINNLIPVMDIYKYHEVEQYKAQTITTNKSHMLSKVQF